MRILCGTDIIEIDRIQKSIEDKKYVFLNKIYTPSEIEYCENRRKAKYQHYAGRFAAKEAIFKAISETLNDKYESKWTDVEIINDENGKPMVHFLDGRSNLQCEISISHCKQYAVATAIVII